MAEQILNLFPLQDIPPQTPLDSNEEQSIDRLRQVQGSLIIQKAEDVAECEDREHINRPGELYRRYRTIEDLPVHAKAFYEIAGMTSRIPEVKMLRVSQQRILA